MPAKKSRTRYQYNPNFVRVFQESAKNSASEFLTIEATHLRDELRDAILGQKYDWYPLSPAYLREKIRQGYDPRILIRTKQYVESLQVFGPLETPTNVLLRVSVPNEIHNSGLPFQELARILEYGRRDGQKPYARPHWRPTWGIFVRDLPIVTRRFKTKILTDFRQRIHNA